MTKKNEHEETAAERIARMKREKEQAAAKDTELVGQLTHQTNVETDFSELAEKLKEHQEQNAKGENEDHVKMTIYIRKDIAEAFNSLITKRGQQKEFANAALRDFIIKKSKELGVSPFK